MDPMRPLLAMVDHHLEEIAQGECRKIAQALGMTPAEVQKDISLIRSLLPIPSRGYRTSAKPEIIEPEACVVQGDSQGGTVKFLAHFLTGGRPAVRYGYSCSSDTSR